MYNTMPLIKTFKSLYLIKVYKDLTLLKILNKALYSRALF